jgi:hypothetical protein
MLKQLWLKVLLAAFIWVVLVVIFQLLDFI